MTTTDEESLCKRLGGPGAIRQVADAFYGRVLADPLLAPHFDGVDMHVQAGMLAALLTEVTGGPDEYQGRRSLREAHARLAIGDAEFNAVLVHLADALAGAEAGGEDIRQVVAGVESVRAEVLGRPRSPAAAP
jgi:hemoglobin